MFFILKKQSLFIRSIALTLALLLFPHERSFLLLVPNKLAAPSFISQQQSSDQMEALLRREIEFAVAQKDKEKEQTYRTAFYELLLTRYSVELKEGVGIQQFIRRVLFPQLSVDLYHGSEDLKELINMWQNAYSSFLIAENPSIKQKELEKKEKNFLNYLDLMFRYRKPLPLSYPYLSFDNFPSQILHIGVRAIVYFFLTTDRSLNFIKELVYRTRFLLPKEGSQPETGIKQIFEQIEVSEDQKGVFVSFPFNGKKQKLFFPVPDKVKTLLDLIFEAYLESPLEPQVDTSLKTKGVLTLNGEIFLNPDRHENTLDLLGTWAHELFHLKWIYTLKTNPKQVAAWTHQIIKHREIWEKIEQLYLKIYGNNPLTRKEWFASSTQRRVNEILATLLRWNILVYHRFDILEQEWLEEYFELFSKFDFPANEVEDEQTKAISSELRQFFPIYEQLSRIPDFKSLLKEIMKQPLEEIKKMDASLTEADIPWCDRMEFAGYLAEQKAREKKDLDDKDLEEIEKSVDEMDEEIESLVDEMVKEAEEMEEIETDIDNDQAKHNIRELTMKAVTRYVRSGKKDKSFEELLKAVSTELQQKVFTHETPETVQGLLNKQGIQKKLKKMYEKIDSEYTGPIKGVRKADSISEKTHAGLAAAMHKLRHLYGHSQDHGHGHSHLMLLISIFAAAYWIMMASAFGNGEVAYLFIPLLGMVSMGFPFGQEEESPEEIVEKYTTHLTQLAQEGKFDDSGYLEEVAQAIDRQVGVSGANNVVLVGDPIVGEALVEAMATRIAQKTSQPTNLTDVTFLEFNTTRFIDELSIPGKFEEEIQKLILAIQKSKTTEKVVLLLNFQDIYRVGALTLKEGLMNNLYFRFKEAIIDPDISIVGIANEMVYKKFFEQSEDLKRAFGVIELKTPPQYDLSNRLNEFKKRIPQLYQNLLPEGVSFSVKKKTLDEAIDLTQKYVPTGALPNKVQEILDRIIVQKLGKKRELELRLRDTEEKIKRGVRKLVEAEQGKEEQTVQVIEPIVLSLLKNKETLEKELAEHLQFLQEIEKNKKWEITEEDIAQQISKETSIPIYELQKSEKEKLAKYPEEMKKRVIGQDAAIDETYHALSIKSEGLSEKGKPIGAFMFLGPTGVGKTELARSMARQLFGSEEAMVRLDMSEFMQKNAKEGLIGAPPGYIGYDKGGALTNAVRQRPYSVVLFDEIEKADPSVFDLLLQILDSGRLTDNRGQTVDFSNTLIIMTSNIGMGPQTKTGVYDDYLCLAKLKEEKESSYTELKETIRKKIDTAIRGHFRTEFIGRINEDRIVVFDPLTRKSLNQILDIKLNVINELLLKQGYGQLELSEELRKKVIKEGTDVVNGARPLLRALKKIVLTPLADEILKKHLKIGETISATIKEEKVILESMNGIATNGRAPPSQEEQRFQKQLATLKQQIKTKEKKIVSEVKQEAKAEIDYTIDIEVEGLPEKTRGEALKKLEERLKELEKEIRDFEGQKGKGKLNEQAQTETRLLTNKKIKESLNARIKMIEEKSDDAYQLELSQFEAAKKKRVKEVNGYFENLTVQALNNELIEPFPNPLSLSQTLEVLERKRRNYPFIQASSKKASRELVESLALRADPKTRFLRLKLETFKQHFSLVGAFEKEIRDVVDLIEADNQKKKIKTVIVLDFDEADKEIEKIRINPFILGFFLRLFKGKETVSFAMTTTRESVKEDEAFEHYFTLVSIPDQTEAESLERLLLFEQERIAEENAKKNKKEEPVAVSSQSVIRAVQLSAKHLPGRSIVETVLGWVQALLPIKYGFATEVREQMAEKLRALRDIFMNLVEDEEVPETVEKLIEENGVLKLIQDYLSLKKKEEVGIEREIQERDIVQHVEEQLKIPAEDLNTNEAEKFLKLEEHLKNRVIGQDAAVSVVANAVKMAKAGLKFPNQPIGSFLFSGPSGVGKTELANSLAKELGYELIRYDMTEYAEEHQINKLIGAPPGYVGYEDVAELLTEKVKRNPNSVILFDEVEKAHPKVFDLLLQILEDGRLTDSKGNTADFSKTVIIMTSNLGMEQKVWNPEKKQWVTVASLYDELKDAVLSDNLEKLNAFHEKLETEVDKAIKNFFRPEFLNRLEGRIVFRPLGTSMLHQVLDLFIEDLRSKFLNQNKIDLQIDPEKKAELYQYLITQRYKPEYGARKLKDGIEKLIKAPLIEFKQTQNGKIGLGDTIVLSFKEDQILFKLKKSSSEENRLTNRLNEIEEPLLQRTLELLQKRKGGEDISLEEVQDWLDPFKKVTTKEESSLEGYEEFEVMTLSSNDFTKKDKVFKEKLDQIGVGNEAKEWIKEMIRLAKIANVREGLWTSQQRKILDFEQLYSGTFKDQIESIIPEIDQTKKVHLKWKQTKEEAIFAIEYNSTLTQQMLRLITQKNYASESEIDQNEPKIYEGILKSLLHLKSLNAQTSYFTEQNGESPNTTFWLRIPLKKDQPLVQDDKNSSDESKLSKSKKAKKKLTPKFEEVEFTEEVSYPIEEVKGPILHPYNSNLVYFRIRCSNVWMFYQFNLKTKKFNQLAEIDGRDRTFKEPLFLKDGGIIVPIDAEYGKFAKIFNTEGELVEGTYSRDLKYYCLNNSGYVQVEGDANGTSSVVQQFNSKGKKVWSIIGYSPKVIVLPRGGHIVQWKNDSYFIQVFDPKGKPVKETVRGPLESIENIKLTKKGYRLTYDRIFTEEFETRSYVEPIAPIPAELLPQVVASYNEKTLTIKAKIPRGGEKDSEEIEDDNARVNVDEFPEVRSVEELAGVLYEEKNFSLLQTLFEMNLEEIPNRVELALKLMKIVEKKKWPTENFKFRAGFQTFVRLLRGELPQGKDPWFALREKIIELSPDLEEKLNSPLTWRDEEIFQCLMNQERLNQIEKSLDWANLRRDPRVLECYKKWKYIKGRVGSLPLDIFVAKLSFGPEDSSEEAVAAGVEAMDYLINDIQNLLPDIKSNNPEDLYRNLASLKRETFEKILKKDLSIVPARIVLAKNFFLEQRAFMETLNGYNGYKLIYYFLFGEPFKENKEFQVETTIFNMRVRILQRIQSLSNQLTAPSNQFDIAI